MTGLPPKGYCPSGKRIYWSERLANRAITRAIDRGEPRLGHYACSLCGRWHLRTKRARIPRAELAGWREDQYLAALKQDVVVALADALLST